MSPLMFIGKSIFRSQKVMRCGMIEDLVEYPACHKLCDDWDLSICTDIDFPEQWDGKKSHLYLYIGQQEEISAGLYGFSITPSYRTMKQLEKFVRSRKGKISIERELRKTFVDYDDLLMEVPND